MRLSHCQAGPSLDKLAGLCKEEHLTLNLAYVGEHPRWVPRSIS